MNFVPMNNVVPGATSRTRQMPGAPVTGTAEVQTLTNNATSGSYRLDCGGAVTAPLAYNANAGAVQAALVALPNIRAGGVVVSGTLPTLVITFAGGLAVGPQPLIKVTGSTLAGGSASVARTTPGVAATLQGSPKGAVAARADTGVLHTNTGTAAAPVWTPV